MSVEPIYKGFGGKPGLVRAIVEKGLTGEGPVPAERRGNAPASGTPSLTLARVLAAWGTFTSEIAPRVAPILMLARAAAARDPEVALTLEQISAARLDRMALNARGLFEAGHLRPEITPDEAADIMWTYSSPELYELLVLRRGWSADRYGRFVGQALMVALLPSQGTWNQIHRVPGTPAPLSKIWPVSSLIWVARSDHVLGDHCQEFRGRRRIGRNRLASV